MRGDLDAGHEVARGDDRAVEPGEHLERVDPVEPLQLGRPDVEDAVVRGEEIDPALDRSAPGQPRAADGVGQAERGVVLVEIARLEDDDRHRPDPERRISGPRLEIGRGQPAALRPAGPADGQVTREDGADEPIGRATTRRQTLEPHPPTNRGSGAMRGRSRVGLIDLA